MAEHYILSLDQGTTSSRAMIFNHAGQIVAKAQKAFAQHFPEPGLVEHDAKEIWSTQVSVLAEALAQSGIAADQIAALGITNQRETTIVWDRASGEPVHRAIGQAFRTPANAQSGGGPETGSRGAAPWCGH